MNRHDDIRNLMNLMESVPVVTLTEDDTSVLVDFTDKVLDFIKSDMDGDPENATAIVDNSIGELVYTFFEKEPEGFYEKLVAAGWPKNDDKEFKYLNAKFKEKFGAGFFKYAEKLEDQAHEADAKSIKPADKKIYKIIGDKITVSVTPKWAAQNLEFYVMSPKKLVVQDTNGSFPSGVIGAPTLEHLKMDQAGMIDWLLAHGIKQRKRPSYKKSPPSYYD